MNEGFDSWYFDASLHSLHDSIDSLKRGQASRGVTCVVVRHVRTDQRDNTRINLEILDDTLSGEQVHVSTWGQQAKDILSHRIKRGSIIFLRHIKLQHSLQPDDNICNCISLKGTIVAYCEMPDRSSNKMEWMDGRFQRLISVSDLFKWTRTVQYLTNDSTVFSKISTWDISLFSSNIHSFTNYKGNMTVVSMHVTIKAIHLKIFTENKNEVLILYDDNGDEARLIFSPYSLKAMFLQSLKEANADYNSSESICGCLTNLSVIETYQNKITKLSLSENTKFILLLSNASHVAAVPTNGNSWNVITANEVIHMQNRLLSSSVFLPRDLQCLERVSNWAVPVETMRDVLLSNSDSFLLVADVTNVSLPHIVVID